MSTALTAPNRRPRLFKAVTLTAVTTFIITSLGQYLIERSLDDALAAANDDLFIQARGENTSKPFDVMVPVSLSTLGVPRLPNDGEAIVDWAQSLKGGPADGVLIDIVVWGQKDYPITLEGMKIAKRDCEAPPPWSHLTLQQGGPLPAHVVAFDLSQPLPVRGVPIEDELGPWEFPLQVSRSEAERFSLAVSSEREDCSFKVIIEYMSENSAGEVEITNDGDDFRVIASAASKEQGYWQILEDGVTLQQ